MLSKQSIETVQGT